jgi:hypothetical protein
VTTSTIEVGQIVVNLFDPARQQLVWSGAAEKMLDIKKDPDKNYRNLQKTMAKMFKNYPPESGKKQTRADRRDGAPASRLLGARVRLRGILGGLERDQSGYWARSSIDRNGSPADG